MKHKSYQETNTQISVESEYPKVVRAFSGLEQLITANNVPLVLTSLKSALESYVDSIGIKMEEVPSQSTLDKNLFKKRQSY